MVDHCTRVLLVEDNPADARIIEEMFQETPEGDCELVWARKLSTGLDKLSRMEIDVVLLDLGLPDSQGLATLTTIIARTTNIPIIVLTGLEDEQIGLEAIKAGAQDYLTKGTLSPVLLGRAIHYATERKAAEEALRESEQRYRTLVEASLQGIIIIQDFKIVYANPAFARMSGYTVEQILTMSLEQVQALVHPKDQAKVWGRYRDRLRGKNLTPEYTYRGIHKDGTIVWLEMYATRIEYGGHPAILAAIIDITDRKQAEAALRNSSRELQAVFDTTPLPIFVVDSDRQVQSANHAAQSFVSESEAEMVGKRGGEALRCLHRLDVPEGCGFGPECQSCLLRTTVLETFETKVPALGIETAYTLKMNGEYSERALRFSTSYFEAEGGPRVVVALEDITERKRAQEALRESEQRYRGIFDESVAAVYVFDNQKRFIDSNRAGVDLLGYSRKELLDLSIPEVDADPEAVLPAHGQLLEGGKLVNYEHRLKCKDGHVITVINNSRPLTDDQGNVVGMLSTLIDVTERKEAQERIDHLNSVLSAVCNVDQLITRERDRSRLLKGACKELVATRGYSSAWIALLDEQRKLVTGAQRGLGQKFTPLRKRLKRGELTECCCRALAQPEVVSIRDPATECGDCPLLGQEPQARTLTVRLAHDGRVYGLMSVSLARELAADAEEQELFCKVAEDIAFALHGLEIAEQREQAETALRLSEEMYRRIFENSPVGILHYDEQGVITACNNKLMEILGSTKARLIGFNMVAFLKDGGMRAALLASLSGKLGHFEGDYLSVTGSKQATVKVVFSPVLSEEGTVSGGVCIAEDITERKEAEAAVRESEERFRLLFENSQDGIVIVNGKGELQIANKAAANKLGYTQDELLQLNINDIEAVESKEDFEEHFSAMLNGERLRFETQHKRKDDSLMDVDVQLNTIQLKGEDFSFSIWRDITERKEAEAALKDSEKSYRSIFENATDAIYIQDREGRFLDVNQSAVDSYGYPREFFIGKTPEFLAAKDKNDLQQVAGYVEKAFEGQPQEFEFWGRRKSGELFPKLVRLNRGTYFGQEVVIAFALDITERKAAEEALRESEQRYSDVVNNIDEILFQTDNEGRWLFLNPAWTEVMGYTVEESLGEVFLDYIHPDDRERNIELFKPLVEGRKDFCRHEIRYLTKAGQIRWIAVFGRLAHDLEGHITGTLGTLTDITERKEAEAALAESEERYRTLVENAQVGICIHQQGRWVFVSRPTLELLGYDSQEELLGQSALEIVHPDSRELADKRIKRMATKGDPQPPVLEKLVRKDGNVVECLVSATPTRYQGAPAFLVTAVDLTAQREVERALVESEARFRALFETSPDGVLIDQDGILLYANPAYQRMFGIEDLAGRLGKPYDSILAPGDLERVKAISSARQAGEEAPTTYEFTGVREDGTQFPVEVTAARFEHENRPASMAIIRDISARKAAREALVRSEARFRALFETSPDGIIIVRKNKLVYANPAFQKLFGIADIGAYLNQPTVRFIAPRDRDRLESYAHARERGEGVRTTYEFHGLLADGTEIPLELTAARFELDGKRFIMALLRDVRDRKRMEEQLLQHERLAVIGQLAAGVAHEMNTPLSNISLLADNLKEETEDPTVKDFALKTLGQVDFAAKIVRELLQFARPSASEFERVDLEEIIERSLSQFQMPAGVQLIRKRGPRTFKLRGNDLQLQEILNNLISNSLDALRDTRRPRLCITTKLKGDSICLVMEDNGCGIPKADLPHLFEPFFSTKPPGKGTGLGLALVQRFVQDHAGTIEVESKVGQGTRIRLTFPKADGTGEEVVA